ncbi:MAG: hypothetical protein WBC88_03520 [Candidatus Zixiibacteriota bacterium]
MRHNLKFAGLIVLCVLLAMCLVTCTKKVIDDDEQDIFGETFGLYRVTSSGSSTEIGMVKVPFLEHAPAYQLLTVECDFNGDGEIATYEANADSQQERIVRDVPVCLTGTDYSFYFSLVDTSIKSGSTVRLVALANYGPIFFRSGSGGSPPPPWVSVEHTVTVEVLDVQNNATPEDGYVGAGSAYGNPRIGVVNLQNPPRNDIDGGSYFYRPDMPDAAQGQNTCVSHSMANSLAWLARKHAFTDSFRTPLDEEMDPYDVNTEDGVSELGWDLNSNYERRGSYAPATGVARGDIVEGKKDFVQRKKLPVETTRIPEDTTNYSGKGVFESIKEALKDGCDVEVIFYVPGKRILHQVTVVGFADLKFGIEDTPYRTLVVHDPNTESYNDLYEIQEDSVTFEKFPIEGGLHTARIAFAVKECYKEPQTACAGFSDTYYCAITEMDDSSGHYQFIGDPFQQPIIFTLTGLSITATGELPFVNVSGSVYSQCTFTASGSGTVAGYPDVTVVMGGSFSNSTVSGMYIMGGEGELPGGQAITFHFSGSKQ